ncbi:type I 3-dehydroquinate dehydratase [Listeria sp. PSOL-1]|uniref:type I 3-dehydroquinate dehydratase n=1 Tax=Listeria sp. PSOL-1 TaxID=1844999 RepID=UPI0013D20126|nr:type I 3-dehydroquinate dehydratase [Listeria sp. PSOL-1]
MNTITVKNVTFGEGRPKICASIVGEDVANIQEEAELIKKAAPDLVEWRMDFFDDVEDLAKVKVALQKIRVILDKKPLVVTFRSKTEGGERELPFGFYFALNQELIATGMPDFVDLELFSDEKGLLETIHIAHKRNVRVIISNHDFAKTPTQEELVKRLRKMESLGADITKIAVMPNSPQDVLVLLTATNEMKEQYATRPFITMSMNKMGVISRMTGQLFGSSVTFGSVKAASAPGQVSVSELKKMLSFFAE